MKEQKDQHENVKRGPDGHRGEQRETPSEGDMFISAGHIFQFINGEWKWTGFPGEKWMGLS